MKIIFITALSLFCWHSSFLNPESMSQLGLYCLTEMKIFINHQNISININQSLIRKYFANKISPLTACHYGAPLGCCESHQPGEEEEVHHQGSHLPLFPTRSSRLPSLRQSHTITPQFLQPDQPSGRGGGRTVKHSSPGG